VHVVIGRKSFGAEQLAENFGAMYEEILRAKPSSSKGRYVQSIGVASTQGPGVPVDTSVTADFSVAPEN
jgi:large subunit ribosomal protein L1